uniref:non-specific serine/threonine protein kinase n=1 Tax=viral metagenome TaxID=1070528 RepID=A0A6C0D7I6_9ZZZZ
MFIKDVSDRSEDQIRNEVELQTRAFRKGLAPRVISTDYKTYIKMEKIPEMCVADKYGEDIKNIPKDIISKIYKILHTLYHECHIQYVDVTPYNFIEHDGRVWVIDFGDAISVKKNWYLQDVFDNKSILEWNPDFK